MEFNFVKEALNTLNLNLDKQTINKVYEFLKYDVGEMQQCTKNPRLFVFCSAAIIAQNQLIPTVDNHLSHSGISIEQVLHRLPTQTVNKFLELLRRVIQKCQTTSANLSWKVDRIATSYRVFEKFEKVVQRGWDRQGDPADVMGIVWAMYVMGKEAVGRELGIQDEVKMLERCLRVVVGAAEDGVMECFYREFPRQEQASSDIDEEFPIEQSLTRVLALRQHKLCDLPQILSNMAYRKRLLDDLINQSQRLRYQHSKPQSIDEIKYLRLNSAPIPPERIHSEQQPSSIKYSNCRIDFDKLEFDVEQTPTAPVAKENTSKPVNIPTNFDRFRPSMVSPLIRRPQIRPFELSPIQSKMTMTPIKAKMSCLEWVNKATMGLGTADKQRLEQMFEEVMGTSYSQTRKMCVSYILKALQAHNPKDQSQLRINKLLNLFQHLLLLIVQKSQSRQRPNLLKPCSLLSLLCLTHLMFHSSSSLPCTDLKELAKTFDVDYLQVFGVMNKTVRAEPNIPEPLRRYVHEMEREVMIVRIWEDGVGYRVITGERREGEQEGGINYMVLEDRLQKHIYDRIYEMHRLMSLDQPQAQKIKSIVAYVLNEKPQLLQKNYIDQIILCALFTVLKLHLKEAAPSLQTIFKKYSSVQLSFNSHKLKAYNCQGEEMNLLDFYNVVFKKQIRQALNKEYISNKLLSTPIRQQLTRRNDLLATPMTNLLTHNPSSSTFFNSRKTINFSANQQPNKYRKTILSQINQKIATTPNSQDPEDIRSSPRFNQKVAPVIERFSPTFPQLTLQHKFSFGLPEEQSSISLMKLEMARGSELSFKGMSEEEEKK